MSLGYAGCKIATESVLAALALVCSDMARLGDLVLSRLETYSSETREIDI
jgi:hypothetical protein